MAIVSRPFQVFVKPAGARCNLECGYCYYLGKEALHGGDQRDRMPPELVEEYIVQHLAASADAVVTFSWHGGEPTILGLDYFRRIVALQARHCPSGRRVINGMQTNGLLLDEEWAEFLAAHAFGIGLSLDGPADLHDCYRVDRGHQPTHGRALRAFRLLRRHKVACDILCAVHARNVEHPTGVYRFFKEIGAQYIGFLPVVERDNRRAGAVSEHTVPAEAYGRFLCTIFDEWVAQDAGRIGVQIFEEASRSARGLEPSLCVFRPACGDVPVVERNGDFYCCDHFVDAAHRLGNIGTTPLAELLESPAQRAFGREKLDRLPRVCRICEVRAMCNGGCPKDRFLRSSEGEEGLNYLCAGLKRFFNHCLPAFAPASSQPRDLGSRSEAATARGKAFGPGAKRTSAVAGASDHAEPPGRNDPCPCGSGRKFKKCCGQRG